MGVAPAFAEDIVLRQDGVELRGEVVEWSPAMITIVTSGVRMKLPTGQVKSVTIPGADGAEREVVEVRDHIEGERYREAANVLSNVMEESKVGSAIGELAIKLFELPAGTIPQDELVRLALASGESPSVALKLISSDFNLPKDQLAIVASAGLKRAEGEDFNNIRAALLKLYQERLEAAMSTNVVKNINASLVDIATLFSISEDGGSLAPVPDAAAYRKNLDRNSVDRMGHAVDLIPLPSNLQDSSKGIRQLICLAQSDVRSARDRVFARLSNYMSDQAKAAMVQFEQSGDYEGFVEKVELWKTKLPPEIAIEPRIIEISEHLGDVVRREKIAFDEYERVAQLASQSSPQFLNEIDGQIIRFKNSRVWTAARVAEFTQKRDLMAQRFAPASTPAIEEPTDTAEGAFDGSANPFASFGENSNSTALPGG